MDGADIFLGLAVIGFAALVTVAATWKEMRGRDIARELEKSAYEQLYEQARGSGSLPSVQQRPQGAGPHLGSWTPACGNPVGYFGRMLWMQLLRRNTWKD